MKATRRTVAMTDSEVSATSTPYKKQCLSAEVECSSSDESICDDQTADPSYSPSFDMSFNKSTAE